MWVATDESKTLCVRSAGRHAGFLRCRFSFVLDCLLYLGSSLLLWGDERCTRTTYESTVDKGKAYKAVL